MANHKSAIKRHRQSLKRRDRNRATKTRIKNVVKAVRQALEQNDKEQAAAALQNAASMLDKASTKKVVHWRNASRRIARLQQAVNKLD
ncbi:30S ribosomal protein S20 [Paucidesulfovibrio longus]|uniref:30S ribosomal protein S20 n=1 Tax=Paucidesulfovibrio longus TaxID=889 RepID=UPI0003B4B8DA|nr:30S ribosomal protein S20 [Paucidesulfovibrio longus]